MHLASPCAVAEDKRAARRGFVSVWMLEFSVLWAVFPLLDQVLSGHVDYKVVVLSWVLVVSSFLAGFLLCVEER